jgi:hypothetical protein
MEAEGPVVYDAGRNDNILSVVLYAIRSAASLRKRDGRLQAMWLP